MWPNSWVVIKQKLRYFSFVKCAILIGTAVAKKLGRKLIFGIFDIFSFVTFQSFVDDIMRLPQIQDDICWFFHLKLEQMFYHRIQNVRVYSAPRVVQNHINIWIKKRKCRKKCIIPRNPCSQSYSWNDLCSGDIQNNDPPNLWLREALLTVENLDLKKYTSNTININIYQTWSSGSYSLYQWLSQVESRAGANYR